MMSIENQEIKSFIASLILLNIFGCQSWQLQDTSPINISLIDVFLYVPEVDSVGTILGLEEMQLILEIKNQDNENYFIELDNWLGEKQDSINFYFSSKCRNNNDSAEIKLAYVTSPMFFLESEDTDTLVVKAHFKELRSYFRDCLKSNDEIEIRKAMGNIQIVYQAKASETRTVQKKGKIFIPINHFYQIVNVPDSPR